MSTSQAAGQTSTTLALNIRAARDARGMRQREIAEAMGVDHMMVSKWERGIHRPSYENLARLADLLGVTEGWLHTDHKRAA